MNTSLSLRLRTLARNRGQGDDGVVAIVVALLLVAILFAAALAIDGGNGYATGRKMQNSADAAAMAGLRQLVQYKQGLVTGDTIQTTALTTAQNNFASSIDCRIVANDTSYTDLGPCSSSAAYDNGWASGVRVKATTASENQFGKAVGSASSFSVTRESTVVAKPPTLRTPFLVCGGSQINITHKQGSTITNFNDSAHLGVGFNGAALTAKAADADLPSPLQTRYQTGTDWSTTADSDWSSPQNVVKDFSISPNNAGRNIADLMADFPVWGSGQQKTSTNARFRVNTAAIGYTYNVYNNGGNDPGNQFSDCSRHSASWKGRATSDFVVPALPNSISPATGTGSGLVQQELTGACGGTLTVGCRFVLPLCVGSNAGTGSTGISSPEKSNGSNFMIYCTNWGAFTYKGGDNNTIWMEFRGGASLYSSANTTGANNQVVDWGGVIVFTQTS